MNVASLQGFGGDGGERNILQWLGTVVRARAAVSREGSVLSETFVMIFFFFSSCQKVST